MLTFIFPLKAHWPLSGRLLGVKAPCTCIYTYPYVTKRIDGIRWMLPPQATILTSLSSIYAYAATRYLPYKLAVQSWQNQHHHLKHISSIYAKQVVYSRWTTSGDFFFSYISRGFVLWPNVHNVSNDASSTK